MAQAADLITFRPASRFVGAEAVDCDLGALLEARPDNAAAVIQPALDRYGVVLFRQQRLEPEPLVALAKRLGPTMDLKRPNNPTAIHMPGHPDIKVISNGVAADGRPLGDGDAEAQNWHNDGVHQTAPPLYTLFYCRQTTSDPPGTYFLDTHEVWRRLPDTWKDRIDSLEVFHPRYSTSNVLADFLEPAPVDEALRRDGVRQPLVCRHPRTGRPHLLLPRRRDAIIDGLSVAESRVILSFLWDFALTQQCRWGAALTADDFVIWDNRALMHARDGWDGREERVMWHITVAGDVPAAARAVAAEAA